MGRTYGLMGAIEGAAGPASALLGGFLGGRLGAGAVLAAGGTVMGLSGLVLMRSRSLMSLRIAAGDGGTDGPGAGAASKHPGA